MLAYTDSRYANASSIHESGRKANQALYSLRKRVAKVIGSRPSEVIFTGSGTESDNLAILGFARANRQHGNHIIVSAIEHKAILEPAKQLQKEGFDVTILPVDKQGSVSVADCLEAIRHNTTLISVMYANNEIGTIQPIKELAKELQSLKMDRLPVLHSDACQATGMLSINVNNLGVDMMSLNSSKIYGPKGIGMLYIRDGLKLQPIIHGGSQEGGLRAGTENLASIAGFVQALEIAESKRNDEVSRLMKLNRYFCESLLSSVDDIKLNGHPENRLVNNLHFSIKDIEGESMLLMLDHHGIAASTGSACTAHDLKPSHVLMAIGQSNEIVHSSIRFTMGRGTTMQQVNKVLQVFPDIIKKLRKSSVLTTYGYAKN